MSDDSCTMVHCDCRAVMKALPSDSVDLVFTSPPYAEILQHFEEIAAEMYRLTAWGGAMVWIVSDQVNGDAETASSLRQALHFIGLGYALHETLVIDCADFEQFVPHADKAPVNRWQYGFVFAKGSLRTFNPVRPGNVWTYAPDDDSTHKMMPPALAEDIVRMWSEPGSLVLDPFAGTGTVARACVRLGRRFIGAEIAAYKFKIAQAKMGVVT